MSHVMTAPVQTLEIEAQPSNLPAVYSRPAAVAVRQAPDIDQLFRLAEPLVESGLLPRHIRNAAQAVAIMLAGHELGMGPMQAVRSLQMVEGKITLAADIQLAHFKRDGGRAKWLQNDDAAAEIWVRHPNGDEHVERFAWTDAQRAALTNKDNWKKYPRAMMRARAATAALKAIGYEGGAGIYDDASGELPGAQEGEIAGPAEAPIVVHAVVELEATDETLEAIDTTITHLMGLDSEIGDKAAEHFASVEKRLVKSERRALAYLEKLEARVKQVEAALRAKAQEEEDAASSVDAWTENNDMLSH